METEARPQPKKTFRLGLYWRIGGQTRFWGWGEPPVSAAQQQDQTHQVRDPDQVEQPWAGLADWLRLAHSSTFFQPSRATEGDGPSVKAPETPSSPAPLAVAVTQAPGAE